LIALIVSASPSSRYRPLAYLSAMDEG